MVVSKRAFYDFLLLLLSSRGSQEAGTSWSYDNENAWGIKNPQCNGNRQSPINLSNSLSEPTNMPPLRFINYEVDLAGPLNLVNNGHSANLEIPITRNGQRPYITGGRLRGRYEAYGLHFHWGQPGIKGSEHTINQRRFDVEMHIVHKNKAYATVTDARNYNDGIAVLAVMFKIINDPKFYYPGLNKIFNKLPQIRQYNSTVKINHQLTLGQMLGDLNTKNFYTYSGSLTSPPCTESVVWHIFARPIPIERQHVEKLFALLDSHNRPMLNNYRPIQARRNRNVYHRLGGEAPLFFPITS